MTEFGTKALSGHESCWFSMCHLWGKS